MEDLTNHSPKRSSYYQGEDKDKSLRSQDQKVFNAFFGGSKTMLEVAEETGVRRANICWSVSKWEDSGHIAMVKEGLCPISKHRAGFYTTNPDLFPKPNQEET